MARVADANEHLTQMNTMYLSTIEALAMAVDAKDQVTHGHIRRVQHYTTGLARALGISDGGLFRAIEAASLLHDMGKLAVPEHILNKPGRLTPAEFERMKLHAGIGADILASIRFPYPVIPIVRHHHENWDGSGYPDGLTGTDIPLGARILSVVDCYDALTSDRPYRRRLTNDDAIAILLERRGSMYDPLVVDTFIATLPELLRAESDPESAQTHPELIELTRAIAKNQSAITPNVPEAAEVGVIRRALSLARAISASTRRLPFDAKLTDAAARLLRTLHADLLIVYAYSLNADELRVRLTVPFVEELEGYRITRGERLSGWVAAHEVSVNNASPRLELPDALVGDLRSALSVPLFLE
jgi:putative nucleotidyltransferase with HDIG domain